MKELEPKEPDIHTAVHTYFRDLLKLRCKKTLDYVAKTKVNFVFKGSGHRYIYCVGGFVVTVADFPVFGFALLDNLFYLKCQFPQIFTNQYLVNPAANRKYSLVAPLGHVMPYSASTVFKFISDPQPPIISIDFSEPTGLLEAEYYINTLLTICLRIFRVRHKQLQLRESVLNSCGFGVELPDLLNFATIKRNNNPAFRKVPRCVSA
jgi:hypothetical protein